MGVRSRRWTQAGGVVLALALAQPVLACFCRMRSAREAKAAAIVVFAGRVRVVGAIVEFDVSRIYKGKASTVISVHNPIETECAVSFTVGEDFLVYARTDPSGLMTDYCMRSRPLASAERDLKFLGAGWPPGGRPGRTNAARRERCAHAESGAELAVAAERAQHRFVGSSTAVARAR